MELRIVVNLALASFLFTNYSAVLAQTDNEYLKALEDEAENLSVDEATRATRENLNKKNQFDLSVTGSRLEFPPGLSITQFNQVLKKNYIGSHIFYNRLNNDKKQKVYKYYLVNPGSVKVRAKIMQVSKN